MPTKTLSQLPVNEKVLAVHEDWRASEYLEVEDLETVEAEQRLAIRLTDDIDLIYTPSHFRRLQHSPGDRLGVMATIGTVQIEPEYTALGVTLPRCYRISDPAHGLGRDLFPIIDQLDGQHRYVRIEGNA